MGTVHPELWTICRILDTLARRTLHSRTETLHSRTEIGRGLHCAQSICPLNVNEGE